MRSGIGSRIPCGRIRTVRQKSAPCLVLKARPKPVRTDPLRLEAGYRSLLVWRSRPGQCLVPRQAREERSAPTMKPVALAERAIRNSSKSRDIVLDPFGGSGTTLIAAERTGRRAQLIELDPKYADVIVQRWQEQTGRTAILERRGKVSRRSLQKASDCSLAEPTCQQDDGFPPSVL